MDTPSDALTRGPEARTLMLEKQNRLTASGNSDGHAYLLISNREGGFAIVGFWLDDAEQRIFIPWGDTWSPGTSFPASQTPYDVHTTGSRFRVWP
jgi:hypothetical protein